MESNLTDDVEPLDDSIIEIGNRTFIEVNEILGEGQGLIADEILAKAMAIRVRNSASCILRLANLGFTHEAYVLLRSITEATLLFHEAMLKNGFKDTYGLEESERVYQLLRKQKMVDDGKNPEVTALLKAKLDEAKKKMDEARPNRFKLSEIAKNHNLLFEYVHYYGLSSAYVHCLPNVMGNYLKVLPNKVIEWVNLPDEEDRIMVVAGALQCYSKMALKWAEVRGSDEAKAKAKRIWEALLEKFKEEDNQGNVGATAV